MRTGAIRQKLPSIVRYLSKLVLDGLPAAAASIIGGILLSHLHFGYSASVPATEQVAPATAELERLVRDEHARIIDYINVQTAAVKSRLAAEDQEAARAAAESKAAASAPAVSAQAPVAAPPAAKPAAPRTKPRTTVASAPPTPAAPPAAAPPATRAPVVAAAADADAPATATATAPAQTNPLIGVKDQVVSTTRRVVGAIEKIPSWIFWRAGGTNDNPNSEHLSSL